MHFLFGPWNISKNEIFYNSRLSFGLVNLKPVVPGHVLVCPQRVVSRFTDLSTDEVTDLWLSVHLISKIIQQKYASESLTITIQDGASAGQTVPHCHVHVIPRNKGDWMDNDDIYPEINKKEFELNQELSKLNSTACDAPMERLPRSSAEMKQECDSLRELFTSFEDIWT